MTWLLRRRFPPRCGRCRPIPRSAAVSRAASADRMARLRTSSATTANPLPASPARAASTAAFRARILVWKAISSIVLRILAVRPADVRMASIAEDIRPIVWLLRSAAPLASPPAACLLHRLGVAARHGAHLLERAGRFLQCGRLFARPLHRDWLEPETCEEADATCPLPSPSVSAMRYKCDLIDPHVKKPSAVADTTATASPTRITARAAADRALDLLGRRDSVLLVIIAERFDSVAQRVEKQSQLSLNQGHRFLGFLPMAHRQY